MATKITDLTELAVAPASDDVLHIIDVGDTSGGVAGTSKKIQVSNIQQQLSNGNIFGDKFND